MRNAVAFLAAAAGVVLVLRFGLADGGETVVDRVVATVEKLDGPVEVIWVHTHTIAPGPDLDRRIDRHRGRRPSVATIGNLSVRPARYRRVRLVSTTVLALDAGALYVDSGEDLMELEIQTAFGTARDIGTQFEVRLRETALRVRVRTGAVAVIQGSRSIAARPGTELTVTATTAVSTPVLPFGSAWDWTLELAPEFETDGQPLSEFFVYLSRESGWRMRYANDALERTANDIILHGSIGGLAPVDALTVALTTRGLTHRLDGGELTVSATDAIAPPVSGSAR